MKIHPKTDKSKTERQWAQLGYVKNSDVPGIEMWINGYCSHSAIYYDETEVHAATAEELNEYWKPIRQRRNEKNRAAKIKRKKEAEEMVQKICRESNELYNSFGKLQKALSKAISMLSPTEPNDTSAECIVIDTETTGLFPTDDELLQVSIIDSNGNTLYNSYIKPLIAEQWDNAQRINNISPEMVKDAPSIIEEMPKINAILTAAKTIIGYNTPFDLDFLKAWGGIVPDNATIVDVMLDFAPIYGEWNEKYGDYKWQKLTTCAAHYGYDWSNTNAHNSLSDCLATLHCYKQMNK